MPLPAIPDLLIPPPAKDFDLRIAFLAALNVLIGLATLAFPFLHGYGFSDGQTTTHVTLGALLTVLALFRLLLAYQYAWVDFLCAFLGLLILTLPWTTPNAWNPQYLTQHVAGGGAAVLFSLIGAVVTLAAPRKAL